MNGSQPLPAAGAAVALPTALAGLCVAGAAGNLLLLAALGGLLRRGGAPALALLPSLSAADLLLAAYCLPPRVAARAWRSWGAGAFVCRTSAWLLQACPAAKGLTWAALGQALGGAGGRGRGRGCLAGALAAVWGAALLLALPQLLFARADPGVRGGPPCCALRTPPRAARFMDVFGKLYPLLAGLAPAALAGAGFWRALRGRRRRLARPGRSRRTAGLLLGLCALFQATWLPHWVLWLWELQGPSGGGPPPALRLLAELLLFLDGALRPAVLLAASKECRRGLRGVCGPAGASPRALPDPKAGEAAETVPPDVEHFWRERRQAAPGEESDPVPWEHQDC